MMPGVNYVIYGFSSRNNERATSGVSLYRSFTLGANIIVVIPQDRVIDDNLKRQLKNRTLCTIILFLLT